MSQFHIILCVAACLIGLLAALVVVGRFASFTTRKLTVIALLTAVFVVLSMFGTLKLGWIRIGVDSLPIILGALLYGPAGGMLVAFLGKFMEQLLAYGITATTVLWIIPPVARGLLIGAYAKHCGYELSRRQIIGALTVTALVVTALNTMAMYLDSVIYGYYSYAYVFGGLTIRIISGVATAVVMAYVAPPVVEMLRRSLREARKA